MIVRLVVSLGCNGLVSTEYWRARDYVLTRKHSLLFGVSFCKYFGHIDPFCASCPGDNSIPTVAICSTTILS